MPQPHIEPFDAHRAYRPPPSRSSIRAAGPGHHGPAAWTAFDLCQIPVRACVLGRRRRGSPAAAAELRRLRRALMRRAVAGIVVLVALSPSCAGAACISEPID